MGNRRSITQEGCSIKEVFYSHNLLSNLISYKQYRIEMKIPAVTQTAIL